MYLFTQSALLKALGWSLLNSLWQMALLWLVYLLLSYLLNIFHQKNIARLNHWLAILVLGTGTVWTGVSFIQNLTGGEVFLHDNECMPSLAACFSGGRPDSSRFSAFLAVYLDPILSVLSCLYLVFLFYGLIRYINLYIQAGRLRYRGLQNAQPELGFFIEKTRSVLGIPQQVTLWLSSLAGSPMTIGFLKPIILLPVAIVNNLEMDQVEAILLHELAHIKRNDYLLNLLMTLVGTFFFFNPFTKLLIRRITREREHHCDDLVMQFQYDPHGYASALLELAKSHQKSPLLAMAATGRDDRFLLQRIKRIMKLKNDPARTLKIPIPFVLFALLAGLLSIYKPQPTVLPGHSIGSFPQNILFTEALTTGDSNMDAGILAQRPGSHPYLPPGYLTENGRKKPVHVKKLRPLPVFPAPPASLFLPADEREIRDYSFSRTGDPVLPNATILTGQPFVPSASFSYFLTEKERTGRGLSPLQLEIAMKIMASIDWNRMERQLAESGNGDNLMLKDLQKRVFVKLLDWSRKYRATRFNPTAPSISEPPAAIISDSSSFPGSGSPHLIIIHI